VLLSFSLVPASRANKTNKKNYHAKNEWDLKFCTLNMKKLSETAQLLKFRAAGKICIELDINMLLFCLKTKISPLKNRNLLTNAFSQQLQYF